MQERGFGGILPSMELPFAAVVTAHRLNVRSAPSATASVIATLDQGAEVGCLIYTPDGKWAQIRRSRKLGWVSAKYLRASADPLSPLGAYPWFPLAVAELGQSEVPGEGANPRILAYHASTDLDREYAGSDETPWCSSFVNFCVEGAGYAGTNSAAAVSWLGWGKAVKRPRKGTIAVLRRTGGHHVAFYVSTAPTGDYMLLGGNQGDRVSVAPYAAARLIELRAPN